MTKHESEGKPLLAPDRQVAKQRYHVVVRTLERWDADPKLGFPPPIYIRGRRYREIAALDKWDRARAATPNSSPRRAVAQVLPRAQRGRFSKPRNAETRYPLARQDEDEST
jgi:hypothetical protein